MENFNAALDQYLSDTYSEMDVAKDAESLKMIRDMALGALLFCFRAEIITDQDRNLLVDKINLEYGIKWRDLLKEKALDSRR
ncbi:MAG: hypothetical protein BI182_16900 [Acetobacterium sp. MES1]|uniref:hypothetical protein n=1 Tax=Acetobacterium sp. MES1 TaxID=1899015 RepID=UPI000B9D085F|nr:hypothetical protein [Acetobacterium sp. MES1]OXS24875.1 MAG: hypothetical protein BI182_16900 [Acetobacterium sp. MES1]